jgi:nickel transport system substrate-binding protein
VQFLNPHAYGPNELFSQNWVYEGLVSYGADGSTLPALATAWTFADNGDGTTSVTFTLRQGVFFHDGLPWNAAACKTNFDNVFARALAATYHSWCVVPPSAPSPFSLRRLLFPSAASTAPSHHRATPPPARAQVRPSFKVHLLVRS